jgi:hypothetical protein
MTASVGMDEHIAVTDWYRRWMKQRLEAQMLRCGSYVQSQYFRSRTLQTEKARGHLDRVDLEEVASKHFVGAMQCIAVVENALAV